MHESNPFIVADAPAADRAAFFRRTYGLVAASFGAFAIALSVSSSPAWPRRSCAPSPASAPGACSG